MMARTRSSRVGGHSSVTCVLPLGLVGPIGASNMAAMCSGSTSAAARARDPTAGVEDFFPPIFLCSFECLSATS